MSLSYYYEWREIKDMLGEVPSTRSCHGVSVINDTLYLYGGEHKARTPIDSKIYRFNLGENSDNKWGICEVKNENSNNLVPEARVAHAQSAVGSKLYIFGGRQGVSMSEAPLNDMYSYDTETCIWENLSTNSTGDIPCPRSFHKMCGIDNILYVFGGCSAAGRLSDLYSYNINTKVWSKLPSFDDGTISGRGGAGFIASADKKSLFVIGGFAGKEMNDVFQYIIEAKRWKEIYKDRKGDGTNAGNEIRPFSVSCGGVVNGSIIYFGGEVDPSEKGHEGAGGFSNDCQYFNGITCEFLGRSPSNDENNPMIRGWACADVFCNGTKFVLFGGLTGNDTNPRRLNDLWVLEKKMMVSEKKRRLHNL